MTSHPVARVTENPGPPFGRRFSTPLILGATLNPVNSSIVATALVPIAAAMDSSVGRVALLVTVLYVASAVAQPAMGRFAELLGPRRLFLAGTLLVAAGGAVGALAANLTTLLAARVLLGVGTSAAFPTAMLMIRRRADASGAPAGSTLGALVIASQVTVLLGLPLGGLLVSLAGWRSTFWINIPLALAVFAMAWRWSPADGPVPARGVRRIVADLDVPGMVLFGGMLCLLVAFLADPHLARWPFAAASAGLGAGLLWWEPKARHPFIDVRSLLDNASLTLTYVRTAGTMLVAYCVMYGLTQWLQEDRGLPATLAGMLIVPMSAAGALVTRPVSKRGLVKAPLTASAALALAVGVAIRFTGGGTPLVLIVALTTLVGVAIGLATVGNQAAVFAQAGPQETGIAAGLLRTSGYVGAIASGSLVGLVFRDGPDDAGLHRIGDVLIAVTALVLVLTVLDRRLPRTLRSGP
ncbi:MFS transporter [Actinomadura formosensis]|uniref:MFS transporter n=1 Tax=Actinomadura formosensis TaxID=60706 RepID=UPI000830AE32|nr:MFS transporter [Actinomadura formosensis]